MDGPNIQMFLILLSTGKSASWAEKAKLLEWHDAHTSIGMLSYT